MEQCLVEIALADYISLDMEFSGLFLSSKKCTNLEEYYKHSSESAQKFLSLQLGVCCCRRPAAEVEGSGEGVEPQSSEEGTEWIMSPFNFYLFPSRRMIYSVDTSSLSWLRSQGFDLNEWAEKGHDYDRLANISCPYMRTTQELKDTGLQRIIECIIEREKPVVLHNGALDLLHIYDKFIASLPESLDEFTAEIQRLFTGGIYDTKRIATESHLASRYGPDGESRRQKFTLDGLAGSVAKFESDAPKPRAQNPLLSNPLTSTPPSGEARNRPAAKSGATSLNHLRRALEKELGRPLRVDVRGNETCNYELKMRALELANALKGTASAPPPKRQRTDDSAPTAKEHEAGFDAMLTMHLFLLELELLKETAIAADCSAEQLIAATPIKNARDKLECSGVQPGYLDLIAARSKIRNRMSKNQDEPEASGEAILNAPLFKTAV